MSNKPKGFPLERRLLLCEANNQVVEKESPPQLPLSLSMGAGVIFANACGDENVKSIVEAWQPKFRITYVDRIEELEWF